MRRLAGAVVVLSLIIVTVVGCSDSDDSDDTQVPRCNPATAPAIDPDDVVPDLTAIPAAVAAVEAAAGGAQQFFEINADAKVVNLFAAAPVSPGGATHALSYTYLGGALAPGPTDLGEAQGGTFAAAALTFDAGRLLRCARQVLPDAELGRFVVTGDASGAVQYAIDAVSERGGELEVIVDRDGTVLGVTPAS